MYIKLKNKRFLLIMPVIYNKTTESKVGTIYKKANSPWIIPPPSTNSMKMLDKWLSSNLQYINKNSESFSGASKTCIMNDNNTVFKYLHDIEGYGNQILEEIKIYKKWYTEFFYLLPKIFSFGKFWMIEEQVKLINQRSFYNCTKVSYDKWADLKDYIRLPKYSKKVDIMVILNEFVNDHSKFKWILENKVLISVIDFCYKSGAKVMDMHNENLGISKKDKTLRILDYGFTNNNC
jgi:hypothetical protein